MRIRGLLRKLDDLGRVTLPKEGRDSMGLGRKEECEIFTLDCGFLVVPVSKKYDIRNMSDSAVEEIDKLLGGNN